MLMFHSTFSSTSPNTSIPSPTSASPRLRYHFTVGRQIKCCFSSHNLKDPRTQNGQMLHCDEKFKRRLLLFVSFTTSLFPTFSSSAKTKVKNPYDERRLLEQNKRRQRENNAPEDFPSFIREGFEVKVITSEDYVKCDSGLIYRDFEVGKGDCPKAGQQVIFHYVGYNESGRRIDSTYLQGAPARIRVGNKALVPDEVSPWALQGTKMKSKGNTRTNIFITKMVEIAKMENSYAGFEEGIKDMRAGGKRRIIIPPELGPPVGPSTFFSSKQFEVFDVELVSIQDCKRRTIGFYSDFVCE